MKFGQLIEYNTGDIFIEKSYGRCVGYTVRTAFSKKLKLIISFDSQSKVLCSLF